MRLDLDKGEQAHLVAAVIAQHRRIIEPVKKMHWGHMLTVLPGVFSPFIAPSGYLGLGFSSLPMFEGRTVLDVGCGSGIVSCLVALSGASKVVGVDINPKAVENSRLNSRQLGIGPRADFRLGDLFDPIRPEERFDIIFADLPFTSGEPKDALEAAFFDPGLGSIHRYMAHVGRYLGSAEARAYLCISSLDGLDLPQHAAGLGLAWHPLLEVNLDWLRVSLVQLTKAS